QELETFRAYFAELTPAEQVVYGRLGFFDIYHALYFNLLLLLLSLNIILASIDHFPRGVELHHAQKADGFVDLRDGAEIQREGRASEARPPGIGRARDCRGAQDALQSPRD